MLVITPQIYKNNSYLCVHMHKTTLTMFKKIVLSLILLPICLVASSKTVTFKYAKEVEKSNLFSVEVNGKAQTVLTTQEPDFCVFDCDAPVKVTVRWSKPASRVDVRPLSLDFSHKFENGVLTLSMKPKDRVVVEFDGDTKRPLFIFANEIDQEKPSPKDPSVHYYKAGKVYEVENLNLKNGETLYIEGGAVVKGTIKTVGASDIKIAGSGVFDSRRYAARAMNLTRCKNIIIKGITLLNSPSWCTYITGCDNITVDNYKVIAEFNYNQKRGVENDALDFLSSTNARVTHCLTYCHDDAYCVKTATWLQPGKAANISFEDCIAWNVRAGNSIEIGHAVLEDIENISYKNIYSIHKRFNEKHGYWNSDISIHCASCGTVRNVSYENIYLEETDNSTISIGVFTNNSKAYQPYKPGHVENVRMNNIFVLHDNPFGSQFFGYDAEHRVENVTIENFYIKGKKVTDFEEAGFTVTNASVTLSGKTVDHLSKSL